MKSLTWLQLPQKLRGKPLLNGFTQTQTSQKARRNLPFISLPSGLFLFEIVEADKSGVFSDFYLKVKQSYQDSPALRAAVKCITRMRCLTPQEIEALRASCGVPEGARLIGKEFLARVQYYEQRNQNGRTVGKNQFRPLPKRVRSKDRNDEDQDCLPGVVKRGCGESSGHSRRDCKPSEPEFWEGC
jgi:hypothetical protein